MPTLDELQRQWLDLALLSKGRFTRAASIKKDWEDYRRRRDKASANSAGLPKDDPQMILVQNGLTAADDLAKQGKFAEAYKALDRIKGLALSASKDRALKVNVDQIKVDVNIQTMNVNDIISNTDFAFSFFEGLINKVKSLPKVADQTDISAAQRYRKEFADQELVLRADLGNRVQWMTRVADQIVQKNVPSEFDRIGRDIALHQSVGNAAKVQEYADRLDTLRQRINSNGKRYTKAVVDGAASTMKKEFEAAIKAIKDWGPWQVREGDSTRPDTKTDQVRGGLKGDDVYDLFLDLDEAVRKQQIQNVLKKAGLDDKSLAQNTKDGKIERSPQTKAFDSSTALGPAAVTIFPPNGELPDDIPVEKAMALINEAKVKMKDFLANVDPASDELFDLMLKTPEEMAQSCSLGLTGLDSPDGRSQSQKVMFAQMAKALREEVLKASPNRMKDDASEITVNGVVFTLVSVTGEGGKGAVRRYADPNGKTVVVKTLNANTGRPEEDQENFKSMAREMRVHKQLLNDGNATSDDSGIVKMEGAAVSDDGSLHMIMEDVEGGDMVQVSNNLLVMENLGVLPPEARKALSLDMVAQTVKGMKALQERGLIHQDMKPQNLMLTGDGKVKIIDYGESLFVDDQGKAKGVFETNLGTTPGFEAPEQQVDVSVPNPVIPKIDSKVDTYALGGIIQHIMAPAQKDRLAEQDIKPVGAMGRLVTALKEEDPDKRPSLDSVLVSSLLDSLEEDNNPEDVKDLKEAAAEMNKAMTGFSVGITKDEYKDNEVKTFTGLDTIWKAFTPKLLAGDAQAPIGALQSMATSAEEEIRKEQITLSQATTPAMQKPSQDKIAKLQKQKAFWEKKVKEAMQKQREEGKKELDDAIEDPSKTIMVPGDGGGKLTLKQAIALRDENIKTIKGLQSDFQNFALKLPEQALNWLDITNKTLVLLDAQCKSIDKGLMEALGPKGKFYLAEQKLLQVSAKFGPRKKTGEEIADESTPKKPSPPPEQKDVPLGEDGIPIPPEMPKDKKVETK